MGGRGSGRRTYSSTECTTDYWQLDVRQMHRRGLLRPGIRFSWKWMHRDETDASIQIQAEKDRITLMYRYRTAEKTWSDMNLPVHVDWTVCHYGAQRPWFVCPNKNCGRRVAILYVGATFACRHCCRLSYRCQRERAFERMIRKADRIRARLDWEPGVLNSRGGKPRGMHWTTFKRLSNQHDNLVEKGLGGMARQIGVSF